MRVQIRTCAERPLQVDGESSSWRSAELEGGLWSFEGKQENR